MSAPVKKPYVQPQVVDHGDIRTITQTGASNNGNGDDGGTVPNNYIS